MKNFKRHNVPFFHVTSLNGLKKIYICINIDYALYYVQLSDKVKTEWHMTQHTELNRTHRRVRCEKRSSADCVTTRIGYTAVL